jgi:hypothetical protein
MKKERCPQLSFSLKEKVVAGRPDEVLMAIVSPSSPCFAGTFSLREKEACDYEPNLGPRASRLAFYAWQEPRGPGES